MAAGGASTGTRRAGHQDSQLITGGGVARQRSRNLGLGTVERSEASTGSVVEEAMGDAASGIRLRTPVGGQCRAGEEPDLAALPGRTPLGNARHYCLDGAVSCPLRSRIQVQYRQEACCNRPGPCSELPTTRTARRVVVTDWPGWSLQAPRVKTNLAATANLTQNSAQTAANAAANFRSEPPTAAL